MSLQFVLGGSGSGKTRKLYDTIISRSMEEPQRRFFLIVPEQFTMQTQKEIVTQHPRHGVLNIDIVSFERLAYRIFEELSVEALTVLDDMGKSMVLRRAVSGIKKKLGFYAGQLDKSGFINQMKSMLSEFYQYGITPDDLERLHDSSLDTPLLRQKVADLREIYQAFKEFMDGRAITSEEILDVLCQVLPQSLLIRDSVIALDGFTGFTPIQYRLIGLFLQLANEVMVTAAVDLGELRRWDMAGETGVENLFHMSYQMIKRLESLSEKTDAGRIERILLNRKPAWRFKDSPALAHLEQQVLRYPSRPMEEEQDQIRLFQGLNPKEEIGYVVAEISGLVKNQGLRYRDIAVVAGDLTGYGKEISRQFEDHGIPYFLDQKKNIMGNPLVELIRSALNIIAKDFSYESVFRYLKTGLVTEDRYHIQQMENYVIALGIRGFRRWNERWDRSYRGGDQVNLEHLNRFRQAVVLPLQAMRDVFRDRESTVRERTAALIRLLQMLQVERQLEAKEVQFKAAAEQSLSKEYGQVYELVMELFDRLVGLLGDEKTGQAEYARILDAGFEEIQVGLIPACVDRVVIGNVKRTRVDHVKVLFFMGVNDGLVPSVKESGGVLSDKEREIFSRCDLKLAPTVKEDSFEQRFYLYLMLTKPSKRLYLSYAAVSSAGKSVRPSFLIGVIKGLYPKLVTERRDGDDGAVGVYSVREAAERLSQGLRDMEKSWESAEFMELFRWMYGQEDYRNKVEQLVEAACYSYEEYGIGRAAARALYGKILQGSVTRLEQYASCAFAHFLKYGLELAERKEYRLEAVDIGNLFHSSIDLFFKEMKRREKRFRDITEEERQELVRECVTMVAEDYGNTILSSSARNAYITGKVERITDRTAWALCEQLKKGDFEPTGMEVSFSSIDNLKAMRIKLSEEEELRLRGRVDRLDTCWDDEHVYIKIIDYKSGSTNFDLAAFYHGTQLQLVVYMDAVMELEGRKYPEKEVVPAGIFYYNIQDPVIEAAGETPSEESVEELILKQLRMNGLVNSSLDVIGHLDHTIETESDVIPVVLKSGMIQESRSSVAGGNRFELLRSFAQNKLRNMGHEILDGCHSVRPYKQGSRTACDFCPYHAVCGFDLKTNGYSYRRFPSVKSEEVWGRMEEEMGVGQKPESYKSDEEGKEEFA